MSDDVSKAAARPPSSSDAAPASEVGGPPVEPPTSIAGSGPSHLAFWGGALLLLGFALPVGGGVLLPALAVVVAAAIGLDRSRRIGAWIQAEGGWAAALHPLGPAARIALLATVLLPAAVWLTLAVRVVGAVAVAYPAAIWSLGAIVVAGVALSFVPTGRARLPAALALALLVPMAGVWGTRYEAQAPDARGWAHSGPIHGILPFQITAVSIDGYGPFDLPINDYVEPDGSRGYDAEALAEALELAFDKIARVHFADGPARAAMAFRDAEVRANVTEPVQERLSREPTTDAHPRFEVVSGTHGQRSSVQFVCPGRRDDPRGSRESLMNRMCPDKYASEASAGLGVTGRWPGYAEGRGNERLGLSKAMGWTRSDDEFGRSVVTAEQRWLAWIALASLLALVGLAGRRTADGLRSLGGGVMIWTVVALVAAMFSTAIVPSVGLVGDLGSPDVSRLTAWLPALLLAAGSGMYDWTTERSTIRPASWRTVAAVAVVAATFLVSTNLQMLSWVRPDLGVAPPGALPMEVWIAGAAELVGEPWGWTILEVEGAIAGCVVALAVALALALLRVGGEVTVVGWPLELGSKGASTAPSAPGGLQRRRWVGWGLLALAAAALTVSRKTDGTAALLPGVIGVMLVGASGVSLLAGPAAPEMRSLRFRFSAHVGWMTLGLVLVGVSVSMAPLHPFVLLCAGAGIATILGTLSFMFAARRSAHASSTTPSPSTSDA